MCLYTMSTYEKWDSQQQGEFRTQGSFSPILGGESAGNNSEFIGNELGDVAWQTECKIGFNRDPAGFTFNVYNGSEKDNMYRCVSFLQVKTISKVP